MIRHIYSKEEIRFLKQNVKGISNKELTEKFNRKFNCNVSENAIGNRKTKYNLKNGLIGSRFDKGHIPLNKGKKWDEYVSKQGQENSRKTTFKKGNIPINYKSIGSERITVDGYIEIKTKEPNKWSLKHRIIYENKNGKIPKGYALIFADGNKQNINLENLILVSRSELLILNRNKLIKKESDLTNTGVIIAKVIDKVNKRKKDK